MFCIENTSTGVRYWSDRRLWYQKTANIFPEGLHELQNSLQEMRAINGFILSCRYYSEKTDFFDVENVLIYNTRVSCLQRASTNGLSFKRLYSAPPIALDGKRYEHMNEYTLSEIDLPPEEKIIERFSVPFVSTDRAIIWKSVSSTLQDSEIEISGNFGLHIELHTSFPASHAKIVKNVFDGTISAFQREEYPDRLAIDRLSSHCRLPVDQVIRLLCERKPRLVNTSRSSLVRARGAGFILNPADELCTEGTLIWSRSQSSTMTVTVYTTDEETVLHSPQGRSARAAQVKSQNEHKLIKSDVKAQPDSTLEGFLDWLLENYENKSTIKTLMSDARRVQNAYSTTLEEQYADDKLIYIRSELKYTASDRFNSLPNPSKLDVGVCVGGDIYKSIYNNLKAAMASINSFDKFKKSRS